MEEKKIGSLSVFASDVHQFFGVVVLVAVLPDRQRSHIDDVTLFDVFEICRARWPWSRLSFLSGCAIAM